MDQKKMNYETPEMTEFSPWKAVRGAGDDGSLGGGGGGGTTSCQIDTDEGL